MNEFSPAIESLPEQIEGQTARVLEVTPLADVVAEIRIDALRQPEKYLSDSVVPHGGE
jgi:hypothetical protein